MSVRYYAVTFALIGIVAVAFGLLNNDHVDWQRLLACLVIASVAVGAVEFFKHQRMKRNG